MSKLTNAAATAVAYVVYTVIIGVAGALLGVISAFLWNGLMLVSPIDWSVSIETNAMMFAGLSMITGSCIIMASKDTEAGEQ